MMMGRLAAPVVAGMLALAGCGDSSEESAPPEPDFPKAQIAATVNAMFEAWNASDGEEVCSYLTPRGQHLVLRITGQLHGVKDSESTRDCEAAVEQSAAATDERIGERVSRGDVYFPAHGREKAWVQGRFRGALLVRKVGGEWLIDVPAFVD